MRGAISAVRRCSLICILGLAGCPGAPTNNTNGNNNGNGNGATVSNAERLASLDKVEQTIAPFELNGDPAVTDQIAALLSAMPEFAEVSVHTDSVIARFVDDELLVIVNNRPSDPPDSSTNRSLTPELPWPDAPAAPSPTGAIIRDFGEATDTVSPKSDKVLLINAMGNHYTDDTPQLEGWFAARNYKPERLIGSIENFRTKINDVGVLYISSHGQLVPADKAPEIWNRVLEEAAETPPPTAGLYLEAPTTLNHFLIWTTTVIDNASIEQYREEVKQGRLAYLFAPNNNGPDKVTNGRHFGITEAFVLDHWRCAQDSLLYMDFCYSADATQISATTNTFLYLCLYSEINAGTYLGWTNTSYDHYTSTAVRYFFDRMLGMNSYAPNPVLQRSFTVRAVLGAMQKRKRSTLPLQNPPLKFQLDLTLDQSYTGKPGQIADLVCIFKAPTFDAFLLPGILNVKAGADVVTLQGDFGDEPGTVTVENTPCPVIDWKTNQIRCSSPAQGAGSTGKVFVTAGGHNSNERSLTQWDLKLRRLFMDYPTQSSVDCASCFYEATIDYTFRADIADARLAPDDPVTPINYIGGADAGSIDVTNAGGSHFIGQGSTITLAPNPDDGAAFIGTCVGFLPPEDNNYLGACFFFNGADRTIAFSPTILAEGLFQNYTGGAYDGIVAPHYVVYSGNLIGHELILTLSPNFTIEAGQQSTGPNSYFEWDSADAKNPPSASDPK